MASTTTQAFIEARQQRFLASYNELDVDRFMEWFAEDTSITNHGSGAAEWTKEQQKTFLKDVLMSCIACQFTTVGIYGTEGFVSWEWKGEMTILEETPLFPLPAGAKLNMIGVTMLWWDMRAGGDGQIKKLVEYNKVLQ